MKITMKGRSVDTIPTHWVVDWTYEGEDGTRLTGIASSERAAFRQVRRRARKVRKLREWCAKQEAAGTCPGAEHEK